MARKEEKASGEAPAEEPKLKRGRPKGYAKTGGRKKRVTNWMAPEVRERLLPLTAEKIQKIIEGQKILTSGPTGKSRWQYPSIDQQLRATEIALRKTLPDLNATAITAAVEATHREPSDPRQLARVITGILSEAKLAEPQPEPPPPAQPEQLLLGRDPVIEIEAQEVSRAAVSGMGPASPSVDSVSPPVGENGEGELTASAGPSPPTHGERVDVVENGAHIRYHEDRKKWACLDSVNTLHSWKATRERALEFAATLQKGDPQDWQPDPFEPARNHGLYGAARRDNRVEPKAGLRVLWRAPRT